MDETVERLRAALREAARQMENYLDNPGCNNQSKVTAMAKLRWAADQAKEAAK